MATRQKRQRISQLSNSQRYSEGFSLFELVVFIIAVAIIYATAANRFSQFPAQAERANFLAVVTQLQAGVNLEMMFSLAGGRQSSVSSSLEGANPMDLMLETPRNYIGAFDLVDKDQLPRRIWYFDKDRQELVYLANTTEGVFLVSDGINIPTDEIRFQLVAVYREEDATTGLPVEISEATGNEISSENRRSRLNGVAMRPSIPFIWGGVEQDEFVQTATSENSG